MKIDSTTLVILGILVVCGILLVNKCSSTAISGFNFNNSDYQYSNASVNREYMYYKCISDDCDGDTDDYFCLEKCHLKSYRAGMIAPDIKDMVCSKYQNNEDAYYRCLDSVYADYKYP